mmetsp:Transcript_7079/g.18285  ORF Transcript_7079/g.18285 Transcript_7079/m.18285 type:complete len:273 (-) Transcript_7079:157-975(-)
MVPLQVLDSRPLTRLSAREPNRRVDAGGDVSADLEVELREREAEVFDEPLRAHLRDGGPAVLGVAGARARAAVRPAVLGLPAVGGGRGRRLLPALAAMAAAGPDALVAEEHPPQLPYVLGSLVRGHVDPAGPIRAPFVKGFFERPEGKFLVQLPRRLAENQEPIQVHLDLLHELRRRARLVLEQKRHDDGKKKASEPLVDHSTAIASRKRKKPPSTGRPQASTQSSRQAVAVCTFCCVRVCAFRLSLSLSPSSPLCEVRDGSASFDALSKWK